jgi:hypothetical protein
MTSKEVDSPYSNAETNERGFHTLDALLQACREGDLATIHNVLIESPNWINQQEDSVKHIQMGYTPLYHAVVSSRYDSVQFLLKRGADPNLQSTMGESALHFAADNSEHEIAKLLLEFKANPNLTQEDGETPLHQAVMREDRDMVTLLLMHKADPNIQNTLLGRAPLHYAAEASLSNIVRELLVYGADPTIQDKEGKTPQELAHRPAIREIFAEVKDTSMNLTEVGLDMIPEARPSEEDRMSLSMLARSFVYLNSPAMTFINTEDTRDSARSRFLGSDSFFPHSKLEGICSEPDSESSGTKRIDLMHLRDWLRRMYLENMYDTLVEAGFDDVESMAKQMATPLPITDSLLISIGVKKPGHRARLLMKLEEESMKAPRETAAFGALTEESTYGEGCSFKCSTNRMRLLFRKTETLYEWLEGMKLEVCYNKFMESGYDNLEMIRHHMLSKYPINNEVLQNQVGIDKSGYRLRILGKLQEELKIYNNRVSVLLESHSKATNVSCQSCSLL